MREGSSVISVAQAGTAGGGSLMPTAASAAPHRTRHGLARALRCVCTAPPPPLLLLLRRGFAARPTPPPLPLPRHHHPQGILRGYDQATNLILEDCHERVYSATVRWLRPLTKRQRVVGGQKSSKTQCSAALGCPTNQSPFLSNPSATITIFHFRCRSQPGGR